MRYTVKSNYLFKDGKRVAYRESPNRSSRVMKPHIIVVHYTGDNSLEGALSWLTSTKSGVSAHLVIAKDGTVYQLLPFDSVAWHAGTSSYEGVASVNNFSIGIENVGFGDDWPASQIAANRGVIKALFEAYPLLEDVVGHEDVAPGRKVDPGPRYPWDEVTSSTGPIASESPEPPKPPKRLKPPDPIEVEAEIVETMEPSRGFFSVLFGAVSAIFRGRK